MKKYFLFQKREGIETLVGRYNSKEEAQERVMEMVEEDEVSIFDFHVEEREYVLITDRVKSYADACNALCINPMDEDDMKAHGFRRDEIARRKLETITEALNEGWKPNWADANDFKYYPWYFIKEKNGAPAGLSFATTDYTATSTGTYVGSRLCFHDRDTAQYAGKTFKHLYEQILIEKL